jgi:hypothetical protein
MTAQSGIFRNDSKYKGRKGGNGAIRRFLEAYWIGVEGMTLLLSGVIGKPQKASRSDFGYAV